MCTFLPRAWLARFRVTIHYFDETGKACGTELARPKSMWYLAHTEGDQVSGLNRRRTYRKESLTVVAPHNQSPASSRSKGVASDGVRLIATQATNYAIGAEFSAPRRLRDFQAHVRDVVHVCRNRSPMAGHIAMVWLIEAPLFCCSAAGHLSFVAATSCRSAVHCNSSFTLPTIADCTNSACSPKRGCVVFVLFVDASAKQTYSSFTVSRGWNRPSAHQQYWPRVQYAGHQVVEGTL